VTYFDEYQSAASRFKAGVIFGLVHPILGVSNMRLFGESY
jgi:hypothetical protein